MALKVIHEFTDGQALTHTQLNENNQAIEGKFGQIMGADLSSQAGITAGQITDRYAGSGVTPVCILPHTSGTAVGSGLFDLINGTTVHFRTRVTTKPGQYLALVSFHFYVVEHAAAPKLAVRRNGATLFGDITIDADDSEYFLANNNPWTNPLAIFADGDEFEVVSIGASSADKLRGVYFSPLWKTELGS